MASKVSISNTISRFLGRNTGPLSVDSVIKKEETADILRSDPSQTKLTMKDMPGPKPSIPFIGTAWQYFPGSRYSMSKLHESNWDKFKRYGPIVREEFQWRKPVVHLFKPEDFEAVFRFQGMHPIRPVSEFVVHYRKARPHKYESAGLANTVGEVWEKSRNILGPLLLKPKALSFLVDGVDSIGDDFVALLKKERNQDSFVLDDVLQYTYRLALEAVYMMSLDTRLGSLSTKLESGSRASDMIFSVKLLFEAFQELYYGLPIWKFYETTSYKKLDRAESLMYEATGKQIQEVVEKTRMSVDDSEGKSGILHTLLKTKAFSDKELKVTIIDFISGGIFTVANSICFLMYHISNNPHVQEKIYEEIQTHCPGSKLTSEALSSMQYVHACVKEAFRLTPTIPCITRILRDDVILSGYRVPAGTPIFCNFTVPCKQEELFHEPERFMPSRWLQPRGTSQHNPFTLVPFGFGHRMCIGRRFAEMEMHMALIKLVHNFKVESTGVEMKSKSAFVLVPDNKVSVILKDR